MKQQIIVALDLEGVLVPEIWVAFAQKTGIEQLKLTTRDIPDYDELMAGRLAILAENDLKLADIQEVIGTLAPLDGARAFLDELRSTGLAGSVVPPARDRQGRACGQLSAAAARPETQSRGGVSWAELQSDCRWRLVQ